MNWVVNALRSSVGRKLIMACTGLLLCLFLVTHLAGNLLMFVGPAAYNTYAHTLHSQEWLIRIAEFSLLILFLLHLWMAIDTTRSNTAARPQKYRFKQSKIPGRKIPFQISPENHMLFTGTVVLAFLFLHLGDFALNLTMPEKLANREPFDKAIIILRTPISFFSYLIGVTILGWHLWHGVTSMLQTLGLRHPKYDPITQNIGPVFAVIIAVGFASVPIYANLISYDPYAAPPAVHEHNETKEEVNQRLIQPAVLTISSFNRQTEVIASS